MCPKLKLTENVAYFWKLAKNVSVVEFRLKMCPKLKLTENVVYFWELAKNVSVG